MALNTDITPIIQNLNELIIHNDSVDISNYPKIKMLTQLYVEEETYITVLLFLLQKNYNTNNQHYQYYEKKYIQTHVNFIYEKEKLRKWLLTTTQDERFREDNWIIFFSREEVIIHE